jgi:poly [ADP-ribose] polymerase 10/14/15
MFFKTAMLQSFRIILVQEVCNNDLHRQFCLVKETMDKRVGIGSSEKLLFHGTRSETVQRINNSGFNRSYCRTHVYGKGVYFARDASYSAQDTYSPPDTDGVRHMYLARVLVGEYCVGKSEDIEPSQARTGADSPIDLCDSTTDNILSPSIYVTYKDNQQYPQYLIHFIKQEGIIIGQA